MASCVVVPTLTATQVNTAQSFVITSTEIISTAPDSVSTVVFNTTTSFITSPGAHSFYFYFIFMIKKKKN